MGKTCDNSYAIVIHDNPIFVPKFKMHSTKEFCLENVYDKALDDAPILNDQSSCYIIVKSGFEGFNPTIFELDKNYVFVDHESILYVIVILLSLFMRLLKIIMREENMVVEVFMVLKHLSMC